MFEIGKFYENDFGKMIERRLTEKLALIPDETKLLIVTRELELMDGASETLQVVYDRYNKDAVPTLLEIFSKRWKTLDLISIMQEFQRALSHKHLERFGYTITAVAIKNSLSSIPIFTETEKTTLLDP